MIKTILAIIGILAILAEALKIIHRLVLRKEHENDVVYYQIIENGKVIWDSGKVKEFTTEEHIAFMFFCKEWANHPGTEGYWNRISK